MNKNFVSPVIYGTGLVSLDIVIGSDINQTSYQWSGGTCGNVLTILSYLGWSSFPISRLNDDPSSECVKKDMKSWGVKLDFASLAPTVNVPIITQEIFTDKNGLPKHKFHWKNCPKCGSWLPNYKPVTLKGLESLKASNPEGNVFFFDRTSPSALDLAKYFKNKGFIIFFEPSAKGDLNYFEEAINLADIIKYSDQRFLSIITKNIEKHHPFLEIQTLGDHGLKYRISKDKGWKHLASYKTEIIKDTCGCGDWTTAGIISKLCNKTKEDLIQSSKDSIELALKYGQALGAWNCGFEGARGGMYRVKKNVFIEETNRILQNQKQQTKINSSIECSYHKHNGICPACHNS